MDELAGFLKDVAPNLVLAAWVIWQDRKVIGELLNTQKWMVEQLMKLHPPQDEHHEESTN